MKRIADRCRWLALALSPPRAVDGGGGGWRRRTPRPRPAARSPSGTRTTPRRWPGASRWSRPGTRRTRTRRSPRQEIPAGKSSEEVIGAAITAGNAPCLIFNTSPAAVPQFQKQGGLVPLDDFPDGKSYIEEPHRRRRRAVQVARRQVLPAAVEVQPGDDLLQQEGCSPKAGIDPENPPLATYDEFLATVAQDRSPRRRRRPPSGRRRRSEFFQSWFDFYPLFAAETGGKQLVEDGKATFDVRRGQAGRRRSGGRCTPRGWRRKEKYNGDAFADGKAAMAIVGPWAIAVVQGQGRLGRRPGADLGGQAGRGDPHVLATRRTSRCTRPARTAAPRGRC